MKVDKIREYCLSKPNAYECYPFGDTPICYKFNNKIFAQLYPNEWDFKITLKCSYDMGFLYRTIYPGKVLRGYHCPPIQQPYWNTVLLDDFPDDELLNMIDLAYNTILKGRSKKVQKIIEKDESDNK